jgi:hypothetical protein
MPTPIGANVIEPIIVNKFAVANADEYARICSFLTNEDQVVAAMREFDTVMADCAPYWGEASERVRQRTPSPQLKQIIRTELNRPDLPDQEFVRRYHFGKTLREIESQFGFSNTGKIFTGFVPVPTFIEMIQNMETWRDSIAFDHGEYTHRLQWMAIVFHFNYSRARLRDLYVGTQKKAVAPGKMLDSANRERDVYLWDFVVDCFSSVSVNVYDANGMIETHIVSDSFRSPNNFTRYFRTCPETPFLRNYLNSSRAKLAIANAQQGQLEGLGKYRRTRLQATYRQVIGKNDAVVDPANRRIVSNTGDARDFVDPPM